jgi:hypothetical protein
VWQRLVGFFLLFFFLLILHGKSSGSDLLFEVLDDGVSLFSRFRVSFPASAFWEKQKEKKRFVFLTLSAKDQSAVFEPSAFRFYHLSFQSRVLCIFPSSSKCSDAQGSGAG